MKSVFYITAFFFTCIWAISYFEYRANSIIHILPVMAGLAIIMSFMKFWVPAEINYDNETENLNKSEDVTASVTEEIEEMAEKF